MAEEEIEIASCNSCGCRMDISLMGPYTNVVCPDCGEYTRVKCQLDHYLITSRYAAGGMSMVFAAKDTTLEREVAIKVLNETYSQDETRMEEFQKEAQITAALSHPHIVRVFTVGKAHGAYYIAMEMVSGGNLEQRISDTGAIPEDELLPIAVEIIAGLRAAKQSDLIHRDIKPGNILFDASGNVKIVDFGLALVTQGGKAKADEIWATPYYVPPEALDGLEEDFRSDMYALGATLYHALSGKPPISDQATSTRAVRDAKENVMPLQKAAPWLKPSTCYLVDKAMALKPEERFVSYQEMEEAWKLACRSEPTELGAMSQTTRKRRAKKKGVLSLVLVSAVALALVAIAATIFFDNGEDVTSDDAVDNAIVEPESLDTNNIEQDNQDYTPEVAAKIGRMYRRSHVLLKERKYDEAKEIFVKLLNNGQIKEPTASWAGVEAVIATWLGGNSGDATIAIEKLTNHIQGREVSKEIVTLVSQLSEPGVIRDAEESAGAMDIVYLMAVALKNWEIGAWDVAVPTFQRIAAMDVPGSSPLNVYRVLSERYLSDYKTLKPYIDQSAPATVTEARARVESLREILKQLQTRGRARFHIRVWQIRALNQMQQLRADQALAGVEQNKAPDYAKVLPDFHVLVRDAKFEEASELLQDVTLQESEKRERKAWMYLADSAGAFLRGLEDGIPDSGLKMEVVDVEGKVYSKIVSSKAGGVNLQVGEGTEYLAWSKIAPRSAMNIHQQVFKYTLQTQEGQLRTEQAICYAWLTDQRDKAERASQMLREVNQNFSKRWIKTTTVLNQ